MADFFARSPALRTLIAFGIIWSAQHTFKFLRFLHVYFLRRSSLHKYIKASDGGQDTWALITGASDGIGKGLAEELCSRGVNVVLHGRNESKLQGVKNSLLQRWPTRQVRILVLDSGFDASNEIKLEEVRDSLKDINLRILINNVGGNGAAQPLIASFVSRSSSDVGQFIDINVRFTTEITRVLLPQLIRNQPSMILNNGSGVSEFAVPEMEMYSGTKAYMQSWSRSLRLELQAAGEDVEVLHLQLGGIVSNTARKPENFLVPNARKFASYVLESAGCGREVIWPYWPHALQFGFIIGLSLIHI